REGDGFDLLAARRRIFAEAAPAAPAAPAREDADSGTETAAAAARGAPATVGLPHALHLTADLPFWRTFFSRLGIPVVEGKPESDVLTRGKELEQAEFCAPMANLHGQVADLLESVDYVFCPMYVGLAESQGYCYYTQFAGPVLRSTVGEEHDAALLTPSLGPVGPTERGCAGNGGIPRGAAEELADRLSAVSTDVTPARVRAAWAEASEHVGRARSELVAEFHRRRVPPEEDITVVLTGRPYTVLDPAMNKSIPRVIAEQGVQAFYHDMLPEYPGSEYESILEETAWRHARDILETARSCATTDGLYPVLVTSFKCSPDSIIIDFFTRIMDQYDKPYLILQVDEHDSSVGYETRIEAGMRTFRNHHRAGTRTGTPSPTAEDPAADPAPLSTDIGDRTLLLPTWDPITAPLLAANLVRHGIDARVLPETPETIRRSMRLNTGQCVPLNVIAEETLEALEVHGLKPEETALWMPRSDWSCNLAMYPHFLKQLFAREGAGELAVFAGDFSYVDISPQATLGAYFAYLFGGLLRRIGCMIRPYEIVPGATDEAISRAVSLFEGAFLGNARRDQRLDEALSHFDAIPRAEGWKPKVAIFGDLYVRDNDIFNQDLIRTIEASGGEVVTTPYTDYTKIIASAHFRRLRHQGKYANWAMYRTLLSVIELLERRYYERFEKWVGPRISSRDDSVGQKLAAFGLDVDHAGESLDNVLKIFRLLDENPDLSLFVQASPAFCCPSLVTEAMSEKIRRITGVPVVPITYDGTGSPKNEMILPYLRFATGAHVR
ncbi:MAG: acyl-CoA dehydratase activase-related protein, partial [Spirochaetia bacterium]